MGLIGALAGLRVHVLVVEAPGRPMLRLRAEAAVRARGWAPAATPADTDLLLVCGAVRVPGELADAVAGVWDQVPFPRARRTVEEADSIAAALDSAARVLADDAAQRRAVGEASSAAPAIADAAPDAPLPLPAAARLLPLTEVRPPRPALHISGDSGRGGPDPRIYEDAPGAAGTATASDRHADHRHADHGHAEHGHMGHGDMGHGMDMSGPGGIPLASGSDEDRDGLEMDVLHLPLGPLLPDWPAGLVVDLLLSGDVVLGAEARLLPATADDPDPLDPATRRMVLALDRAATLLRLAGLAPQAARVTRAVDRLLGGAEPARVLPGLRALARRLRRSATLAWSLAGDVDLPARIDALLQAALDGSAQEEPLDVAALAASLVGRELDSVRLRVAAAPPLVHHDHDEHEHHDHEHHGHAHA